MAENVIWIVIVIILAIAVLAFGGGLLGRAQTGAKETETIQKVVTDVLGGKGLYSSCKDWLAATNRYDVEAILSYYKVPDRAEPFGNKGNLHFCSSKEPNVVRPNEPPFGMKNEALKAKNAGKTNIPVGDTSYTGDWDDTQRCITTCTAIVNCYETIERKNPGQSDSTYNTKLETHLNTRPGMNADPNACS